MRTIDADALVSKCGNYYVEEGPEDGFIGTLKCLVDMQPTVFGWISVQDRLPEYTGWYLTYHHKINLCVVSWFTGDGWEDGDWGAYEDGWVSHWMPLPEDPKEVSGDAND